MEKDKLKMLTDLYNVYLMHKESMVQIRKVILDNGGEDPELQAFERGDSYPYNKGIKEKIKFILKKCIGQKLTSTEIGNSMRAYEPETIQASVNQFCSFLGRNKEIGVIQVGNKNKYFYEQTDK